MGLLDRHLIDQAGALAPLIDGEEDVANVDYDRTLEVGLELDITAHSFPVSVEARPNTRPFLSKTGLPELPPVISFVEIKAT